MSIACPHTRSLSLSLSLFLFITAFSYASVFVFLFFCFAFHVFSFLSSSPWCFMFLSPFLSFFLSLSLCFLSNCPSLSLFLSLWLLFECLLLFLLSFAAYLRPSTSAQLATHPRPASVKEKGISLEGAWAKMATKLFYYTNTNTATLNITQNKHNTNTSPPTLNIIQH